VSSIAHIRACHLFEAFIDDSAAHVSEEIAGAARAAPIAILIGVAGTAGLGWILLIAASYATSSVPELLTTTFPLPMGQLFLDTLGKQGMLAIWSFVIVVQVGCFYALTSCKDAKPFNMPCSLSPVLLRESMLHEWYSHSQEITPFLDPAGGKR
jgi:amino acid transporter